MAVNTPVSGKTDLVTYTIKVDGKEIDGNYLVSSIETAQAVNRIPSAKIALFDGSAAESNFEISDLDIFLPGKSIDISAGYGLKEKSIFKGIITRQGISASRTGRSLLTVSIKDKAAKMTLARKNELFLKIKDSELIGKLITNNGLKKDVAGTTVEHEEIIQYYATDWDLMLMRAEANGLIATVADGTVTVKAPDTSQEPVLMVKYGDTMIDFRADMDASTQYDAKGIKSYTWDYADQKLAESGPGTVSAKEMGNVPSSKLAKVFDIKTYLLQTGAEVKKESLKAWSSAGLLRSKLSKIVGSVTFQGSSEVTPGKVIQIEGVGKRFEGNAFISSVTHRITRGDWLTEVGFGMPFKWFSEDARNIEAPEASGLAPAIRGMQTGIVKKIAKDPTGEFRVLVELPLLQNKSKGVWARLGTMYATGKSGSFFMPEKNDEVVVGFMNEDPAFPIILGSLYSKKIAPPFPPDEENTKKALFTKGNLQLLFDDKDLIITIQTPGKHVLMLNDKSGEVSITDSNKNKVSLSKKGVVLESASNLTIKAKGNITLDAGGNLKSSAKMNVSVEGLQIDNSAKTKFSAKGNAASELTSSGMLTVRGSLVKIN